MFFVRNNKLDNFIKSTVTNRVLWLSDEKRMAMTSYEVDQVVFSIFLAAIIGASALYSGWLIYKKPDKHIPFQYRLREMLFGQQIKDIEISARKHGVSRMIVGGMIIAGGILQALGLFLAR